MGLNSLKYHLAVGLKLVSSLHVCIWICMVAQATADDDGQVIALVPVCNRMAVPDYPKLFIQQDGMFLSVQGCLDNTYFDENECGCVQLIQVYNPVFQEQRQTPTMAPMTAKPVTKLAPPTTTTTVPTTTTATTTTTTTTTTPAPTRRPMVIRFFPIPVLSETRNLSIKRKITTTPVPDRLCDDCTFDRGVGYTTHKSECDKYVLCYPNDVCQAGGLRLCDGCTFDRGVGYNTHKSDCDKYVLCYPKGVDGHLTGEVRNCGIGQYWDPDLLTCRPSKDVNCPYERCYAGSGVDTYRYDNDCRGYWKCQHGVSVGYCCPKGQAYRYGVGCVRDPSCNTPCDAVEKTNVCDKTVVPGKPWKFRQIAPSGYVDMACARGTVFTESSCRCELDTSGLLSKSKVCKKEFDLDFKDGIQDKSGNGNYVDAFNITYTNDLACLVGDGALLLPRFSNAEIGNHLVVKMTFKFSTVGDKMQALVFNGDCDQYSSVVILANKDTFLLGLRNRPGKFKTITAPSYPNAYGWYDVTFSYHNGEMSISQGGLSKREKHPGGVSRSRCALKIGWGENYESFTGCIDNLSISFCSES